MEVITVNSLNGESTLAIYDDSEKDLIDDLCKTEDYGKLVDEINEQEEDK